MNIGGAFQAPGKRPPSPKSPEERTCSVRAVCGKTSERIVHVALRIWQLAQMEKR
jgi:hypothetical protein